MKPTEKKDLIKEINKDSKFRDELQRALRIQWVYGEWIKKMENKLNNKQKFWLSFTAILMVGLSSISLILGLSWVNSPTYWSTYHNFDFKGDEYIASSLESLNGITDNSRPIEYCTLEGTFCSYNISEVRVFEYNTRMYLEALEWIKYNQHLELIF